MLPLLQRGILTALRERPRVRTLDLQYFVSLFVDTNLHTRAPVAVVAIRAHPLPRCESWPVALGLMAALLTDCPFAVTILEPGVRRRRITKPSATRFESR